MRVAATSSQVKSIATIRISEVLYSSYNQNFSVRMRCPSCNKNYVFNFRTHLAEWAVPHLFRYFLGHLSKKSLISSCCTHVNVGRDSAVGIGACYGLDGPGIESWWERDVPQPSRSALRPTQTPILGFFPGGKAAGVWPWPPDAVLRRG